MKILIVAGKHTGSNLFCSPAIRLIRQQLSGSFIDVVSLNKLSAEVFNGNPDIDRLHVTQKTRAVKKLTGNADIALCLNPKSLDLLADAECPVYSVPNFSIETHQADAILEFTAATLGLEMKESIRRYVIASGTLPESLQNQNDNLIGLHLGCGKTAKHGWKFFHSGRGSHQKLWPLERYIELSQLITETYPSHRLVITGTHNEAFLARQFLKAQPNAISLIGQTSARSLFTSIEHMDAFISHDCGVLHIAAATSTPIVSLFASTFPEQTGPYPASPHRIVLKASSMTEIPAQDIMVRLKRFIPVINPWPRQTLAQG